MAEPGPFDISSTFVRLRNDASVEPLPVDASFWQQLAAGGLGDFHHQFLVSCHDFDTDWSNAEMHPNGDEVVCLLDGAVTFVLAEDGGNRSVELSQAGAYLIVPRGTWHTAKVRRHARVLFITAGEGTQHKALDA